MKLKTLKDLYHAYPIYSHVDKAIELVGNPSEDTIKDYEDVALIDEKEIKKEAIKDIRAIQMLQSDVGNELWSEITGSECEYSGKGKSAIINYIRWKNNITEEDLE